MEASRQRNRAICGAMRAPVIEPFVVGADSMPRLPLITGDPPFEVTGPKKGKADMNPVEFARHLEGQQKGLLELSVADFIANRGRHTALSIVSRDATEAGPSNSCPYRPPSAGPATSSSPVGTRTLTTVPER